MDLVVETAVQRNGFRKAPRIDYLLATKGAGESLLGCVPPVRSEGATDDERALGPSPTCVVPVVGVNEMLMGSVRRVIALRRVG